MVRVTRKRYEIGLGNRVYSMCVELGTLWSVTVRPRPLWSHVIEILDVNGTNGEISSSSYAEGWGLGHTWMTVIENSFFNKMIYLDIKNI